MKAIILFGLLSVPVIIISWRSLFTIRSHGFYRFFAWEGILWLAVNNYKYWFVNPFEIRQMISRVTDCCGAFIPVSVPYFAI
jgi:hypothetical protein